MNILRPNKLLAWATLSLLGITPGNVFAQCPVTAKASPISIVCGEKVTLSAITGGLKPLNNDFNSGIGSWATTTGGVITDGTGTYNCMGPSPDPPSYFLMGSSFGAPRTLQSNPLDLTQGGAVGATACWYMKYGTQSNNPSDPCEGIETTGEGIYLEYSTNCSTWTTIGNYSDPKGGTDPTYTSWNQYCVPIPAAALTANTCFRWIQKANDGVGYDVWAIDDVEIILTIPGYTFDWDHDAQGPMPTATTPDVYPYTNTVYTVTYTNGTVDNCTSNITVNVTKPQVTALTAPPICPGSTATLTAISPYQSVPPTACGAVPVALKSCDPISEGQNNYQVGAGTTVNGFNSGTNNVFGDFGDAFVTSQLLFRASELTAAGMTAGKISSLSFDIANCTNYSGSAIGAANMLNFSVAMKCVTITTLSAFQTGLTTVYNPKSTSIASGAWTANINFDNWFYWDGTSNIVVQTCWYLANGAAASAASGYAKTRNSAPGYNCFIASSSNFSDGICDITSFVTTVNQRPNVKFGLCAPKVVTMSYNWSPAGTLNNPTSRTPIASPSSNTVYTVTAYAIPYTNCATTANVSVEVAVPTVSATPPFTTVCPPATPSMQLTANGSTTGNGNTIVSYTWTPATGLSSATIANPRAQPTANTTYVVRATDSRGCTATARVLVGYCMVIPLELISFTGELSGNVTMLYWSTASEKDISHFIIERSSPFSSFKEIGRVSAKGSSSSQSSYRFVDPAPSQGLNYYRLRVVAMDGQEDRSHILSFSLNSLNPWQVVALYPVPANDELSISLIGEVPERFELSIYAMDGKLIQQFSPASLYQNTESITLSVQGLAKGMYLLKLRSDDGREEIRRFTK